jgi:hypothetical protein
MNLMERMNTEPLGALFPQVKGCFLDSQAESGVGADSAVFKDLHQGFKARTGIHSIKYS